MTTTTKINEDHALIYVACLSAYNNGYLHGAWIDASEGYEHVRDEITKVLSNSPMRGCECCEEWAIHDLQGFGNYRVEEYSNLEELCAIADLMKECGDRFPDDVVSELINDYGIDGAKESMNDYFIGEFDSPTDLAYQYVEDACLLDGVNKTVAQYFDYEAFGRDLEMGGDVFSVNGHYFWNR